MRPRSTVAALVLVLVLATAVAARAERDPTWQLKLAERVELTAGASGALALAIVVDRGLSISKDAALVLDLAPDPGVTVKKRRLGRGEAIDPDADSLRFAIPLHASAAGDFAVKLHLRFWLCGARSCRPIDVRRSIAVAVTAATAPAPTARDAGADAAPTDAPRGRR